MTTAMSWKEFVCSLQQAKVVPRPANEEWAMLIHRLGTVGTTAEIDEETYFYFLEVLPPKYQRGGYFAFAEGAEALRLFWKKEEKYFCRQLTWDETKEFCRLARIPLPW